MAKVTILERVFEFGGVKLPDPGTNLSIDEVKNHYSQVYPELVNSTIKGPLEQNGAQVYKFNIMAGTKG